MGLGKDPGVFLIAPIALGVAAPIGAFFLDRPSMKRGQPMAISAGLMLGAGEGLGIWGTQRVSVNANNAWGFRGLSRAAALGSTIGGVAGFVAGEFMEPPPTTSVLAVSGAFWGTAIGSMFGYGSTNNSWGKANDRTAIGGLVGYNVGNGCGRWTRCALGSFGNPARLDVERGWDRCGRLVTRVFALRRGWWAARATRVRFHGNGDDLGDYRRGCVRE